MLRGFVVAVLAAGVTGCASARPAQPVAVSEHLCDNGQALQVAWWPERAEVAYGSQRWTLPLATSGSGARYSDGVHEVWEHQGVVRISDGAVPPVSCSKRGR